MDLYTQPSVAPACLYLQDDWSTNVNLLLFARWLETRQLRLGATELQAALGRIGDWDSRYVQALRQLRRQMKQDFAENLMQIANVREQIKRAELLAERQELLWLEELAEDWTQCESVAAGDNLSFYLNYLKVTETDIAAAHTALVK